MITFIVIIHIFVCIILIALVLVQSGKGGGLGGLFGAGGMSQSLFGVRTGTFLTRLTTIIAIIFMLTSLSLAVFSGRLARSVVDRVKEEEGQKPRVEEESPPPEVAEEKAAEVESAEEEPTQAESDR